VTDAAIDGASVLDAPVDAPTAPVLVQQATTFQPSGDSLSLTLPASPIAGHVLVLIGGTPQAPLTSVSGGGATWTRAAFSTVEANTEIWVGVTSGSSATVTVSMPGNISQLSIAVSEWANLAPTNLVHAANAGSGVASPATAGPIMTTSAPSLLIFGVDVFGSSTWGLPSNGSWTPMMPIAGAVAQAAWYRVEQTSGTFTTSVSETGGGWDAALVALRIAP
jgi:hypothetical protein